jgi:hypothetical protein
MRGLAATLAIAVSAVALLAGCGGGSDENSAGSTTSSTDPSTAMAAFQSCMKEQGVELPDRGQGGVGPPPQGDGQSTAPSSTTPTRPAQSSAEAAKLQKALETCQSKLPDGAGQQGGPQGAPFDRQGQASGQTS